MDFLLGGSVLNYIGHRACIRRESAATRRERKYEEVADLAIQKDLAGDQERNCIHRATRNGAWLSSVPHHLNGTELSQEEFRNNLCLRYGLMPQDIFATCDGCGKNFLIDHAVSCPKGGLLMARHNDDGKEWGALGARALVPIAITY